MAPGRRKEVAISSIAISNGLLHLGVRNCA
jgi:hypothetical protein